MIELNVKVFDSNGQPIPSAIITLYVLDKFWHECPMEPRIRQQANFYNSDQPFAQGTGTQGPFFVYGSVMAAGFDPAYFPMTPWDGTATLDISVALSFKQPFKVAPRPWAGNMCGVHIVGAPAVPGGAADSSLILDWFYERYEPDFRAIIRATWKEAGIVDVLVSWPDSQEFGHTPAQFRAICQELIQNGFRPCAMLSAKPTSSDEIRDLQGTLENIMLVLPLILKLVPRMCLGWELSLWLSPSDVQWLIDQLSPLILPNGTKFYVHFQEGYPSYQQPGGTVADFWHANVNKLTGILYQKKLSQNNAEFLDSLSDCLQRFCGGFNMPDDKGDGLPFDFIGLELSAQWQFNGQMTTEQGNALGRVAINAPHCFGPNGAEAWVLGSGNGF